jgi:MFS family permease
VLRYRDFRLLWAGQFVSVFGTQMHTVALSWQVYQLTGSVVQLALLGLVRAAALITASFFGGALADSRVRRRVMFVTQSVLALISAGVAVATFGGWVNIWLLYGVALSASATSAFDGPARQALIPALVPRDQLVAAMTVNSTIFSVARMVGPAAGGLVVAGIGVGGAYTIDAASFLAVIAALLLMHSRPATPSPRVRGVAAVAEGLRFIVATPIILGVMLIDFLATLLGSTVGLAPVFASDVLNIGPQGLGLLLSAPATGAVFGGVGLSIAPVPRRPGAYVSGAVVAYGVCLALFGLSGSLFLALLALAGAGVADAVSVTMRQAVRNLATPDELRGRVAASHSALAMGGPRLGEFQSGMTAALIGPRNAMLVGGLGCVAATVAVSRAIPTVLRYRTDDGPADGAGGELAGRVATAD